MWAAAAAVAVAVAVEVAVVVAVAAAPRWCIDSVNNLKCSPFDSTTGQGPDLAHSSSRAVLCIQQTVCTVGYRKVF